MTTRIIVNSTATAVALSLAAGEVQVIAAPDTISDAVVRLEPLRDGDIEAARAIDAAQISETTERLSVSVPAPQGQSVSVGDGRTVISGGTVISGTIGGRGNIGSVHIDGGGITAHTGGVRAVITVPAGGSVQVTTRAGSISTRGPLGELEADTRSGTVSVDRAQAVSAETGCGDILIARLSGRAQLRTGSGDIHVHVAAGSRIRARTGNGNITVRTDPGATIDDDLHTGNGRIRVVS